MLGTVVLTGGWEVLFYIICVLIVIDFLFTDLPDFVNWVLDKFTEKEEVNELDPSEWIESGNLSDMAHDYAKEMEEVYHNKIAQGLFSCVYNAWLDGFMEGLTYNNENKKNI